MSGELARAIYLFANALFAIVFLSLTVIIFRRRPLTKHLKRWGATCLFSTLYGISVVLVDSAGSREMGLFFVRCALTAGSVALFFFSFFAFSFAAPARYQPALKWFTAAWVGALQPLFWCTPWVVLDVAPSEFARWAPVAGSLMPFHMSFIVWCWAAPLVFFSLLLRRSKGLRRTQSAYALLAVSFGAVSTTSALIPATFHSHSLLAISPAFLLPLFPLTITYAMVRYRLWDVRTIAHRTAVWGLLSLVLLVPIYLVLRLAGSSFTTLGKADLAGVFLAVFLLAHLYLRAAQPRLDHLFQRRAFDRRKVIEQFSKRMSELGTTEEVASQLVSTIKETLYPRSVSVVCRTDAPGGWRLLGRSGSDAELPEIGVDHPFIVRLAAIGSAIDRSQLEVIRRLEQHVAAAEEHFADMNAQVCLPLVHGDALVGLVHLGEKENLRPYSRDDLELLDVIGAAATIGLSNAFLFERVDAQRRELEDLTNHLELRVQERTAELELVNVKLAKANADLLELDKLKNTFFANVTHELRTPLALILAPLHSMLEGDLGDFSEQQLRHLRTIERNALKLLKLIDDLLDLSRIDEDRMRLRIGSVDVAAMVSRLAETALPLAQRKQIALSVEAEARPVIEADEEQIERAIINLLSNALKFTDPGGRVRLAVSEQGGEAVVAVEDTGAGIPENELPRVFERFYQVNPSRAGGSGIGLSLALKIVELHGGAIDARSTPGQGSTFTVRVPKAADAIPASRLDRRTRDTLVHERRRAADRGVPEWTGALVAQPSYKYLDLETATERRVIPRERPGALGPKEARILIAEDNLDMLRFLNQMLGERFEVWAAQDGGRAWELLERERHDLVIADVMMPGMTGFELCRQIKSNDRTSTTPVILLTARNAVEDRVEGQQVGADAYLPKPFSPRELNAVIDRLLESSSRATAASAQRREAAMETLLAGMAHELRNSVQQVAGAHAAIEVLITPAIDGSNGSGLAPTVVQRLRKLTAASERALERIGRVVRSLQRYAHQGLRTPWTDVAIDGLIRRQLEVLPPAVATRVHADLGSEAVVRGPEEELRQLVLNLIDNAIDATEGGGEVWISTTPGAGRMTLSVRDTGMGIPPEIQERVFDLFFTTKDAGRGTGVGLALAKRTVIDLGGEISLRSRPGEGTDITVVLPTQRTIRPTTAAAVVQGEQDHR